MSTTTRSAKWIAFAHTMIVGLALALGIAFVGAAPQAAWLGFAVAAMHAETDGGRACSARIAGWFRR